MEDYIPISYLNDFIFCPRSIYFHTLYSEFDSSLFHKAPQIKGKFAHKSIDEKKYSCKTSMLQNFEVYSSKYKLFGKIDIFDIEQQKLIERKREIKMVYDGYIFQVYAHYFCLSEMGFEVKSIVLHDLIHNKNYPILLPQKDEKMFKKFENLICEIQNFSMNESFSPNKQKCENCIYFNLCDFYYA